MKEKKSAAKASANHATYMENPDIMRPLCYKLTWIALWIVNAISRDSNSGSKCKCRVIIYRAKVLPIAKAYCNANLEYDHKAQCFKHTEPDLETLNDKGLGSVSIAGVQIYRIAI